ncbi:MAG: cell division protein SepF [Methanomassiliicoccales archaeon]|nr:cell division protein SepF [Methanomassiliicoccales archaeon]
MPLLKKPFGKAKEEVQTVETDQYIDLGLLSFDESSPLQGKGMVKVAEIYRYEDLSAVTQPVYNGNILLIDYSALSNDSLTLKRITNELKAVARDTNGDVAAIGKNIIVVTPNGIKVDRQKIKGGFT